MSEFTKVQVGKEVSSFDVSPEFPVYSGVEIVDDSGNAELIGNKTGRVVSIPGITRSQAQAILEDLTGSGFQYQPYVASDAHINPAAEIGDGVTINGVYSGIYKMSKNFSPAMVASLEAPQDEEVDHEFPYEPKQDRVYKREIAESQAAISLTQEQISAEVSRATSAEESLSSAITQTAQEISANVVKKTGGSSSSFGWTLNDSSWELKSNNSTVFKATSSGIEISGKVTATSGKIGGFDIGSSAITYNKQTWGGTSVSGIYFGTRGLQIGRKPKNANDNASYFAASASGTIEAQNIKLLGSIYFADGSSLTTANVKSGISSVNTNGGTWSTGAGYGYNYNDATKQGATSYPSTFRCGTLTTNTITITRSWLTMNGKYGQWKTATIGGVTINYLGY